MQSIHIGTSGFYYDHWIGNCYPADILKRDLLPYYASHFKTVEINSTFYHLPKRSTILHWLEVTPDDFRFTLKANRTITHAKKLHEVYEETLTFIRLVRPLKAKLGVILFQIPPSVRLDVKLLDDFICELPRGYRYAIEFRHASWMDEVVFQLLALHNIALCLHDYEQRPMPWIATADFVYLRLHGPSGRYRGSYDQRQIDALAQRVTAFSQEGKRVFCYFNNDMEGFAWYNAKSLAERCMERNAV